MKYFWQKRYITSRWDLEQEDMRLVAWITQNRIDKDSMSKPDTLYVAYSDFGYPIAWKNTSHPDAEYVWRMWWCEKDDKGHWESKSSSDDINYSSMEEAKLAVQRKFLPENAEVKTIFYPEDFTENY